MIVAIDARKSTEQHGIADEDKPVTRRDQKKLIKALCDLVLAPGRARARPGADQSSRDGGGHETTAVDAPVPRGRWRSCWS